MRKRVEMLNKKVPYKEAGENTVNFWNQKKSVSLSSLEKYCEDAVQNTVELWLSKNACQNARQKRTGTKMLPKTTLKNC